MSRQRIPIGQLLAPFQIQQVRGLLGQQNGIDKLADYLSPKTDKFLAVLGHSVEPRYLAYMIELALLRAPHALNAKIIVDEPGDQRALLHAVEKTERLRAKYLEQAHLARELMQSILVHGLEAKQRDPRSRRVKRIWGRKK